MGPLKAWQVDYGGKKAYFGQRFDKTKDEAKVLAHRIIGHKDTLEDYEKQLSNKMSAKRRLPRSDRLSI